MSNIELVDIYDDKKNKKGYTKIRHKDTLESGEYVIGIQAIILNSDKKILISQRSSSKKKLPLKWECNGGALLSGEDVIKGLIREIEEELGINLSEDKAIYLKTAQDDHRFKEIYLFEIDIDIDKLKFADGEVISAKWVTIDEFMQMFNDEEIVYNVDFDDSDYAKCLDLLKTNNKN